MSVNASIKNGKGYFADTVVGTEEYHGIDLVDILALDNDTITSVTWVLPTPLVNLSQHIEAPSIAAVKIRATLVGTYKIVATVVSADIDSPFRIQSINYNIYLNVIK